MNGWQLVRLAGVLLVLTLVTDNAIAQQAAPPTETKGVTVKPLTAVDLGPEIEGMQKRQLRVRLVTMAPGAVFGFHDHKDRPGAVYVIEGALIEHRGDVAREYKAGDSWTETKETVHWAENKGSVPAVLLVVDIFKQP